MQHSITESSECWEDRKDAGRILKKRESGLLGIVCFSWEHLSDSSLALVCPHQ